MIPLAILTLWSTAAAAGDGFIATQDEGGERDAIRINDGKGDVVKKLDRSGKAMAFDKNCRCDADGGNEGVAPLMRRSTQTRWNWISSCK